jgi:hypothetical protein
VAADGAQLVQRLVVPRVAVGRRQHLADLGELLRPVRREVDPRGEAGRQPRIGGEQPVHALRVAGEDHHQVVAVVLGALQQHLEGLVAVRVALAVARVRQRVRLVHEQHAAERRVDQLVGLHRRLAQELPDEVGALGLHEMVAAEQPQGVEHPAEDAGDGGLPGTGRPGEDEVPLRRLHGKPLAGP